MIGYHLHRGVGADLGRLVVTLDDRSNAWTDTTDRRRPSLFTPMWKVDLFLFTAGAASNPNTGSTVANMDPSKRWFSGFIVDPQVERPINNYQRQTLFCVGNALELTERITSMKITQDRAANGTDFDTSAPLTANTIMTDLITKTYHFPHNGLTALTNFNVNEVTASDITFSDFHTHFYTVHQAIQEVAQRAGYIWGVKPDGTIFMFPRNTQDSGLLLTNNLTDSVTTNWDVTRLGIMRNVPTGYIDSGAGSGYSFLHGVGGVTDFLMQEQTSSDAALDLSPSGTNEDVAFPFLPTEDSISRFAVWGSQATPDTAEVLTMRFVSDDGNSVPQTGEVKITAGSGGQTMTGITVGGVQIMSGTETFDTDLETTAANVVKNINSYTSTPNYRATSYLNASAHAVITIIPLEVSDWINSKTVTSAGTLTTTDTNMAASTIGAPAFDLRRRIKVEPERLNDVFDASGGWMEVPLETLNSGTRLTPYAVHWIVFEGHDKVRLDYQSTYGTFARNRGTTEDQAWIHDTGSLKARIYHSHSIDVIIENVVAKKTFGTREVLLPISDFPSEDAALNGLIGFSQVTSRTQRLYQPLQVTPPSKPPELGKTTRLVDKFNGMDTTVDIIGFDIQATSFSKWNRGVDSMTLHLEETYYRE
jgi:hypothetical protein